MVQSILFFILGALCVVFLTALAAPAFWRRAVRLTRRGIEATVPLTGAEIAAQKDMLRAEFAVRARKLEMVAKALQDKCAGQAVEIGRAREELKAAAARHEEMESGGARLRQDLHGREMELQQLSARMNERERVLEEQAKEIARLSRLYEEASFSSSNRQIELVARESEVERLSADLSTLRNRQKEADARSRDTAKESHAVREALSLERKKSVDLDKKLGRLMATIADYEERLDRREKELMRLRGGAKSESGSPKPEPRGLRAERKGAVEVQFAKLLSEGRDEDLEGAAGKLAASRDRLAAELMGGSGDPRNDDELRGELLDLAAEVVVLAARIDGPDSPVLAALEAPASDGAGQGNSLAARARAILKVAAAGPP